MQSRSTTVLLVRRDGAVCMASDGQVTLGETVIKSSAAKVRRIGQKKDVLVGFAGGAADGLALLARLEAKLEEYAGNLERAVVELAKDWRTDRALRQLQAQMIVCDEKRSFYLSGAGDLMQPDPKADGAEAEKAEGEGEILSIGSGSNYAMAAARALTRHTDLPARDVAEEAMRIAAEICIYTNDSLTFEELPTDG